MFVLVVFVCFVAATVGKAQHGVTGDSKHAKHYPGSTLRETKDGQFVKIVGKRVFQDVLDSDVSTVIKYKP